MCVFSKQSCHSDVGTFQATVDKSSLPFRCWPNNLVPSISISISITALFNLELTVSSWLATAIKTFSTSVIRALEFKFSSYCDALGDILLPHTLEVKYAIHYELMLQAKNCERNHTPRKLAGILLIIHNLYVKLGMHVINSIHCSASQSFLLFLIKYWKDEPS